MLQRITDELPTLYTLKDIHGIYKDEYDNYASLYHDLDILGYVLTHIDDSQKMYFVREDWLAARRNAEPYQATSSKDTLSSRPATTKSRKDYGIKLDR